ncbi:SWIM zinc finger family protein [Moraxella bovis]|uniref:SWIM zinc finger domain-containing protein n=1 Tax=Moraxella bovis TaxID=476 RepID=A0AAQ2Q695_MORBO|nr:SWIM zinc finger family protein [Moraxella bovis]OOR88200.1 hypothetical protein B0182_10495 [Moraxella bovis]UYZ76914.1 SWIM zinc finger domain-containing protein [Moraxella bovis]UYZ77136.1 SWIM zinc finger domain-containing protein [Moraxella bovis]UYZ85616.1 SWIM zinc finger domain-containing protein [Moraxella bovis]UYZ91046.1 SWIM zinc finger domain-containing protein [Moraxella bovis]
MSIYLNYDDDALATFANIGLVRRAKKSLDEVKLIENSNGDLIFELESFHITLPKDGIAGAKCTCPANECCKHILASVLYLKENHQTLFSNNDNHQANNQDIQQSDDTVNNNNQPSIIDDLLNQDPKDLQKQLKKSDRLLAFTHYQELIDSNEVRIDETDNKLNFYLKDFDKTVYYFKGLSLKGMLSELPDKQKSAIHLALIAYVFYQHNKDWQWTDEVAVFVSEQNCLSDDELVFIDESQSLCVNFLKQGLSHLAKESVLSLRLLSLQARTYQMPNLAQHIRRIYGAMTALLNEDIHSKEENIFNELAFLYHYLQSFINAHHSQNGEQLEKLRGKVINTGDDIIIKKLIPLGAEWWETSTGAKGISFCFYNGDDKALISVTNGRANSLDSTFHKQSAYQMGVFGASVDYLKTHAIALTKGKLKNNGTLSPSELSRYQELFELKTLNADTFKQEVTGIDDWQTLTTLISPTSRLFLTYPNYVLLYPANIHLPDLDEINQQFLVRLDDNNDTGLLLSLKASAVNESKLKSLEYLLKHQNIFGILAKVIVNGDCIYFSPCSLLLERQAKTPYVEIFNLDYDDIYYYYRKKELSVFVSELAGRIAKLLEQKRTAKITQKPKDTIELLIARTLSILAFYANTGRALETEDQQELLSLAGGFLNIGLALVCDAIKTLCQSPSDKDALLKLRYVLDLAQSCRLKLPLV